MPNTVTQRTLIGAGSDRNIYRLIHILSDGSEETDLVVYDNSTLIADVSKGKLCQVWLSGSPSATIRLEWDQGTDSPAFAGDPTNGLHYDFRDFGGICNPNGASATGDLTLTTANLDSGDEVFILIHIVQG